ncbi:uncharacterized protein KY384_001422 [Bacidia gigantensis]|uniref:uncharacterized protein n=1 Tax=Bacidia gigantensis TaxID=2732470 RepID=UPI001D042AA5|nr:uncharacterized protein KY384_001422 [Bacidia gigantensis]KAG8533681.1 hypothetical protein KY384_001422 [Bacidia gigantensis]
MASNLISYAGWTFLPGLVSGWIQSFYYGITIRAGDPKPQPGTPRYQRHRRRIQMTVIVIYLLYTIYEADYALRQEGDFYQDLRVSLDADEKQIKSKFRKLYRLPSHDPAAVYHPDKVEDPSARAAAEIHFVTLKQAQDTLSDPIKRFAYERFGADTLQWQHCSSMRDYILRGVQVTQLPLYLASLVFLVLISFTSYLQAGRFWRYFCLIAVITLEFHTITRPYRTPILTKILNPVLENVTTHPPLLPYQLLSLARKATVTLFIAFSQLSNLYEQPKTQTMSNGAPVLDLQQLARLETIAKGAEVETGRLLGMDMAPFVGDEQGTKELKGRIKDWLVNNTIRADPEVRDAVGKALARRRVGTPVGSRLK